MGTRTPKLLSAAWKQRGNLKSSAPRNERYFEGTPAELLPSQDWCPSGFVRVGRMDVIAVISPQAMACWRKHKRDWNRLSVCRSHYNWI